MTESTTSAFANAARILVVDDEPNIRLPLVRALNLSGYRVEGCESGGLALERLKQTSFDLMILDMQMPGMDGTTVMAQAREICPDFMILILTGHATLESAIAAVKSNATDYLLKPASLKDIALAVENALERRHHDRTRRQLLRTAIETLQQAETLNQKSNQIIDTIPSLRPDRFLKSGRLTLDRDKQLAIIDGSSTRAIELTKGETIILEILAAHPDEPFSCGELARRAWNYELDELGAESLVRPYISRLRHKLEDNPEKPSLILTVRGRGYLLALA